MCGRYYRIGDKQRIAEAFRAEPTGDSLPYAPCYNIAPTTIQPVLRQDRDTLQRELVPMRWGLVGFGPKGIEQKCSTFNARAEDLKQSLLWKRPLHRQRCIVPMHGFYEWRKSDKQGFRFTVGDGPMGVAGLWDAWRSPKGVWLQNFTIITTEPNTVAQSVHDRMPAILQPKDYDEWLHRKEVERPPIHLLRPFPTNTMQIHSAHPQAGNVCNQRPEMLNSL